MLLALVTFLLQHWGSLISVLGYFSISCEYICSFQRTQGRPCFLLQLRGEDRTSVTDLQNLLKQTAEVYRNLVQHAKAASVPVPPEAQLGTGVKRGPDEMEYDEFAAANATDWDDFQDEGAVLQL